MIWHLQSSPYERIWYTFHGLSMYLFIVKRYTQFPGKTHQWYNGFWNNLTIYNFWWYVAVTYHPRGFSFMMTSSNGNSFHVTGPTGNSPQKIVSRKMFPFDDVMLSTMASQITSLTIVYSTVYSGTDQTRHQRSASQAFVMGIHRWPVNSPHKWPVTQKNVSIWWRHHEWSGTVIFMHVIWNIC